MRRRRPPPSDARTTAAGIAVALPLIGAMASGSSMLTLLASLIGIAASAVSPVIGVIALAVIVPLPRPLVIPFPGLYVAMLGAIMFGLILRLPLERRRLHGFSAEVLLAGGFVLVAAASFLGGQLDYGNPRSAVVQGSIAQVFTIALTFVVVTVVMRGRSPTPVLVALLVSAALSSALALAQWLGIESLFGDLMGPSKFPHRMTGPFGDPNYFGSYLAVGATLALACVAITRSRHLRIALILTALFIGIGIALTFSRGGYLAVIVGVITLAFTRDRRIGIAAVVLSLVVVAAAYPAFSAMRFGDDAASQGVGLAADADTSGRLGAWSAGFDVFLSSPLAGVGWGNLKDLSSADMEAHNWYIHVLAELGLVGFAVWALFLVAVVLALRKRSPPARTIAYPVIATWLVASLFIEMPLSYESTGPVMIALAVALTADWSGLSSRVTDTVREARPSRYLARTRVRPAMDVH